MKFFIKKVLSLKLWNSLDIQFANMLASTVFDSHFYYSKQNKKKFMLILASACLSAHMRLGHTCLPICVLSSGKLFQEDYPELTYEFIKKTEKLSINDWQELLSSLSAVGDGSSISPLVLEDKHLYLHRIWQDECIVAHFLSDTHEYSNNTSIIQKKIINILNKLFPDTLLKNNWHKIATAISLTHPRVFISGGPGTGKTSLVSTIIAALMLYNDNSCIRIATPTGKAAAILSSSCHNNNPVLNRLLTKSKNCYEFKLMLQATTLHNLLGSRLYKKKNEHQYFNILDIDYLIIDEASMVDLSILSRLISFLPNSIKIIFLGDHNQLCSVDPGSIFKDICRFSNFSYSLKRTQELTELIGYTIPYSNNYITETRYCAVTDGICILKKNYRFNKNSGINKLAYAINSGNYNHALSILNSKIYIDIAYIPFKEKKSYITILIDCSLKYLSYFNILKKNKNLSPINILEIFNDYRILCAVKNGPFGVIQVNHYIEQILNHEGLIKLNNSGEYIGKPIMILQNSPELKLWNGDIGILLPNSQNRLSAYFFLPNKEIKIIQTNQLPKHETCFAMTIHKAQGSTFQYTSIILPNTHLPILTRELLYTAVTRARQKIFLYTTNDVLIQSINLVSQRYGRLYEKIKKYSKIQSN